MKPKSSKAKAKAKGGVKAKASQMKAKSKKVQKKVDLPPNFFPGDADDADAADSDAELADVDPFDKAFSEDEEDVQVTNFLEDDDEEDGVEEEGRRKQKKKKATGRKIKKAEEEEEEGDEDVEDEAGYGGFISQMASLEGSARFLHHADNTDLDAPLGQLLAKEKRASAAAPSASLEDDGAADAAPAKTPKLPLSTLLQPLQDEKAWQKALKPGKESADLKLSAPLPTPQAQRVQRAAEYDRVKQDVSKWDAVVHARRARDTVTFPLEQPDLGVHSAKGFALAYKPKTPLEMEVAALLHGSQSVVPSGEELSAREKKALSEMTLQEALEKRQELSRIRALQSYHEAKMKRQNKIKSKSYRKVVRKIKKREKERELEELQRTNPDLALERLEQDEKRRIGERASLKHRNSSKYLQQQTKRAKYNKESQQNINAQIQQHRELTAKPLEVTDDEEEVAASLAKMEAQQAEAEAELEAVGVATDNPWMTGRRKSNVEKPEEEEKKESVQDFSANLHSFLSQQKEESRLKKAREAMEMKDVEERRVKTKVTSVVVEEMDVSKKSPDVEPTPAAPEEQKSKKKKNKKKSKKVEPEEKTQETEEKTQETEEKTQETEEKTPETEKTMEPEKTTEGKEESAKTKRNRRKRQRKAQLAKQRQEAEDHVRERLEMASNIDDLFDEAGQIVRDRAERKLARLVRGGESSDEEEDEEVEEEKAEADPDELKMKSSLRATTSSTAERERAKRKREETEVDPQKFVRTKPKDLAEGLAMMASSGDEEEEDDDDEGMGKEIDDQEAAIAEAFADDNVMADFKLEKKALLDADKPKRIDLTLPGWGDWGGQGLKVSARKRRRFTVRAPPAPKRKDAGKAHLILNDHKDTKIHEHQVSSVPFPYASVADYEASMRAPLGETFVPRTTFKKTIQPAVVTKRGAVIEPMDQSELVKRKLVKGLEGQE